jgi:glycerol-3-phosphate O-acyltransferase
VHLITLREILRDADVAHAISSVVREHHLSEEQTEQALIELHVPRAANVARISLSLGF